MNETIGMCMSTWHTDDEKLNAALISAKWFDKIFLHVDCENKHIPDIDFKRVVPPIEILWVNKHLDAGQGSNYAIQRCDTDWVSIASDDDYFFEDGLKKVVDYVKGNDVDADVVHFKIKCNDRVWGAPSFTLGEILSDNRIPCPSFFRRKLWDEFGGLQGDMAHDWIWWAILKNAGKKFKFVDALAHQYWVRDEKSAWGRQFVSVNGDFGEVRKIVFNTVFGEYKRFNINAIA